MPTNSSPNPWLTEQLLTLDCVLGFPESYSANFGGSGQDNRQSVATTDITSAGPALNVNGTDTLIFAVW